MSTQNIKEQTLVNCQLPIQHSQSWPYFDDFRNIPKQGDSLENSEAKPAGKSHTMGCLKSPVIAVELSDQKLGSISCFGAPIAALICLNSTETPL